MEELQRQRSAARQEEVQRQREREYRTVRHRSTKLFDALAVLELPC